MALHAILAALMLAGCMTAPPRIPPTEARFDIAAATFSQAAAGGGLPSGWEPWIIDRRKPATRYALVDKDERVVVHAVADASVSALVRSLLLDPASYPLVRWRWKAERLIPGADELDAAREDSPARLLIAFAGDADRLDPDERRKLALASAFSGREMPYAMLMYVWSNEHPPGSVIANPRSSRVRMVVVEQGAARVGRWLEYERDVAVDYRRAFGEEPGSITAIGVMTDADDTGATASTYYGDIVFRSAGDGSASTPARHFWTRWLP